MWESSSSNLTGVALEDDVTRAKKIADVSAGRVLLDRDAHGGAGD